MEKQLPKLIENERILLFQLLREGLWGKPVESVNPDIRWEVLLSQLKYQTVLGLASPSLIRLSKNQEGLREYARLSSQQIGRNIQNHNQLNGIVAEIFTRFRQEGLFPVLLKGQGIATFYPTPTLRHCGDIDVYIGEKDFSKACQLIDAMGATDGHESPKHYDVDYKGVKVELHRYAEIQYLAGTDSFFQQLTQDFLQTKQVDYISLSDNEIPIPSLQFNVLYVFNHLWHHFVSGGIGLRQLCDWAMVLHRAKNLIDEQQLKDQLQQLHLLQQWQITGWLVVNYLGLPLDEMPFYDEKVRRKAEILLAQIEEQGNFGKYGNLSAQNPQGKIGLKIISLFKHSLRLVGLARISPIDAFWGYVREWQIGLKSLF